MEDETADGGVSGHQKLLSIEGERILLDTNILIQGTEAKSQQRKTIMAFCKQNDVHICDTVFYEFVRNCSIETFRQRRFEIESWPNKAAMPVLREDNKTQTHYGRLWLLYLYLMKGEPKRLLHQNTADMWIAAVATYHLTDRILTTDHSGDFPNELFDDQAYDLSDEKHRLIIHLKTFRRTAARSYWQQIQATKKIELDVRSFL